MSDSLKLGLGISLINSILGLLFFFVLSNFLDPNMNEKTLQIFKKTSIAVACSRWEEPFGRTSLEASANGCAVIITNKGGLPETSKGATILKKINDKSLFFELEKLIKKKNFLIRRKRKI